MQQRPDGATYVASGPGNTMTASIANGATASGVVDLQAYRLAGIITPAAVDGTAINFQVSLDGQNFSDLYADDGSKYAVTMAASRAIAVDITKFAPWPYVKLVTSAAAAARDYKLALLS